MGGAFASDLSYHVDVSRQPFTFMFRHLAISIDSSEPCSDAAIRHSNSLTKMGRVSVLAMRKHRRMIRSLRAHGERRASEALALALALAQVTALATGIPSLAEARFPERPAQESLNAAPI
jgi:hypothetical protein